ncbi:MAG TPA: (deoxy)nucleoside triphosphate pyrophosphohydrolase [Terriglobales bacterium]|nr:(deoxy)nucleoside triphosphate pyrophosphohydrolase [Terriglobales bacterium]
MAPFPQPESQHRPRRRSSLPSLKQVVAALIFKDGEVLVCQRTRYQTMPLKWEFPGGKIEEGELPRDALRRELDEELGIDARIGEEVASIRHDYRNGAAVELRFYSVREYQGEIENRIFKEIRWVKPPELPRLDFLEADLRLVKDLAEGKIAS